MKRKPKNPEPARMGRPPKSASGEAMVQLPPVRFDQRALDLVEKYRARLDKDSETEVTRADALRALVDLGLQAVGLPR